MNKIFILLSFFLAIAMAGSEPPGSSADQHTTPKHTAHGMQPSDAETRVIDYLREHIQPGQPLVVSELYNTVFTKPEERQALNKLYNAFFRIPLFLAGYQEKYGSPPSLRTIAQQFDLHNSNAADVLLRVMESDPRVPRFLTRDSKTGEITRVNVEMIRSDPRFGQSVERQLSGWEGKAAPAFNFAGPYGPPIDSAALSGKVVLLYIWFTGCPPCMKESPQLGALQHEFSSRGFTIVGANADKVLGLTYGDDVRQRYIKEQKINFSVVDWTKESDTAYGKISIFPTLFLIDGKGVIAHHWVGYAAPEELRKYVSDVIK
jgi:thiol-disulfide isomerase/thioredoxin